MILNITLDASASFLVYVPIFVDVVMIKNDQFLLPVWEVARIMEAVSIILSFVIYIPFLRVLYSSGRFHRNLKRVFEFVTVHLMIEQLLRLVLLFYETQGVLAKPLMLGDSLIVIVGLVRVYSLIFLASIVPLITLERLMATVYLWDYEKQPRSQLSLSILFGSMLFFMIVSMVSSITFAYDVFDTVLCVSTGLLITIFLSGLICRLLFLYNAKVLEWVDGMQKHRKMAQVTPIFGHRAYDLSVKYQIGENMKVFAILRRFLYYTVVGEAGACVLGAIALTAFSDDTAIGQVLMIGLDLAITLAFNVFPFLVLHVVKEWGEKYRLLWRRFFNTKKAVSTTNVSATARPSVSVDRHAETDKYFDYYKQSW